ncbi:hypothetical protein H7F33_10040 [Pedobacter sp. PAMC26386]|nr:hypothetical protein H7F33_10040 [Pedobacter sp. PAMC26386]
MNTLTSVLKNNYFTSSKLTLGFLIFVSVSVISCSKDSGLDLQKAKEIHDETAAIQLKWDVMKGRVDKDISSFKELGKTIADALADAKTLHEDYIRLFEVAKDMHRALVGHKAMLDVLKRDQAKYAYFLEAMERIVTAIEVNEIQQSALGKRINESKAIANQ